jgi:hypothetical protein
MYQDLGATISSATPPTSRKIAWSSACQSSLCRGTQAPGCMSLWHCREPGARSSRVSFFLDGAQRPLETFFQVVSGERLVQKADGTIGKSPIADEDVRIRSHEYDRRGRIV